MDASQPLPPTADRPDYVPEEGDEQRDYSFFQSIYNPRKGFSLPVSGDPGAKSGRRKSNFDAKLRCKTVPPDVFELFLFHLAATIEALSPGQFKRMQEKSENLENTTRENKEMRFVLQSITAAILQRGGANRAANPEECSVRYNATGRIVTSSDLVYALARVNQILKLSGSRCYTLRQLGRSFSSFIIQVSQAHEISGELWRV